MPPKKQEEEPAAPVVVWTVLPVVWNSSEAVSALKKAVTLKKTVDRAKLIQLLKEKGIEKYLSEGVLSRQGELFICQNMHSVAQQYLAQCRKPADPKKDQKKDTKKDSKKEEVVAQQTEKPLEFDFEKTVTEFLFYIDTPLDSQALEIAVNNGLKPEIVVWIEEQIKEGTQIPNYDVLNNQRTLEDFIKQMNSTLPQPTNLEKKAALTTTKEAFKKETIKNIQHLRMQPNSSLENTIIIEVPFYRDLQHPEKDTQNFLTNLFRRLCQLSMKKQQFESWCKDQKVVPMVPTIKETVRREVVVEQKKEDKKGGKGAPAQPVTEIIQEVIEKKYESFPHNIKSDLVLYKRISQQRKADKDKSKYYNILQNLIFAISSATQPHPKVTFLQGLSEDVWSRQRNKPISKITINNLKDQLQEVRSSDFSTQLTFPVKITAHPLTSAVTLASIIKQHPFEPALEHQYKLQQFTSLSKTLGSRVFFTFDDRKYVQRLDGKELNARINQQLEFDPKIYHGQCVDDNYNLMILARVNPPGRVLYSNYIFDWKVKPNFQYWESIFHNKQDSSQFFDYGWRDAGNLKVLSKKMMPTDNSIITENLFTCGDSENRLITLSKDSALYGLQKVRQHHLFWKQEHGMKTAVYTNFEEQSQKKMNKAELQVSVQRKSFTVLFTPYPVIYWHQNELEVSRSFGARGQITKRMKDGSVQLMYPNGDLSTLRFGKWTHYRNNSASADDGQRELRIDSRIDADKHILIRQDSTVFVTYPNKDKSIIFKDGTHLKKIGRQKMEILNPEGIVVRISLGRDKDFNVIGSGSAFAYLGFSSLLQRSYDGAIYELHHPSFSWHSYTQGIDRAGTITFQKVFLLAYPDKSIIKLNDQGVLTFMNKTTDWSRQYLEQRWIQLFTAPEYHREGIYDVDLLQGQLSTRDAESNHFRARVDGTGKTQIAVSFNIGGLKEEKNHFGQGMHVPDQNYFLPPPQNCVTPRLFVIYPDGRGQEYLTVEQIQQLKSWNQIEDSVNGKKITQYTRQAVSEISYFENTFSARIETSTFSKPNGIEEAAIKPNNIRYTYSPLHFRSIEEIQWNRDFSRIKEVQERIRTKRESLQKQLSSLRTRIKT